nr:immunoglobulin heavy chain junction region [Macaca mulatta]MOX59431.1 immunoglobulin heavy chain junction region [Macaca mulatta]MOX59539.1 immunoglobulin heavy chain junction region [Macaca mulatta]MOX59739.1 immunoglobulin heavy chain junction region [Macaca mulatta]MOX60258.1 immunoglobulin heavy chain junction region [Macaca mulatta]
CVRDAYGTGLDSW